MTENLKQAISEYTTSKLPTWSNIYNHIVEGVVDKVVIEETLRFTKGKVAPAYRKLGMAKGTLYAKMRKHKINPNDFKLNKGVLNKEILEAALSRTNGKVTLASRDLKISTTTMRRKIKQYQINAEVYKHSDRRT